MSDVNWHEPKQARSRQRFQHILETAAALFATHTYEAVTTNHIAEEAGVPIGSLYQYFPNKEGILAALVDRYVGEMEDVFPQAIPPHLTFVEVIDHMIDSLAAVQQRHAAFTQIFTTLDTLAGVDLAQPIHQVISSNVERVLAIYYPTMNAEQRSRCALAGIGIVKGMLILAKPPYALPPEHLLTEVKTALLAYVEAFIHREGLD